MVYKVKIKGKTKELYFDRNVWLVEGKDKWLEKTTVIWILVNNKKQNNKTRAYSEWQDNLNCRKLNTIMYYIDISAGNCSAQLSAVVIYGSQTIGEGYKMLSHQRQMGWCA